jgi:hypothetical protein
MESLGGCSQGTLQEVETYFPEAHRGEIRRAREAPRAFLDQTRNPFSQREEELLLSSVRIPRGQCLGLLRFKTSLHGIISK